MSRWMPFMVWWSLSWLGALTSCVSVSPTPWSWGQWSACPPQTLGRRPSVPALPTSAPSFSPIAQPSFLSFLTALGGTPSLHLATSLWLIFTCFCLPPWTLLSMEWKPSRYKTLSLGFFQGIRRKKIVDKKKSEKGSQENTGWSGLNAKPMCSSVEFLVPSWLYYLGRFWNFQSRASLEEVGHWGATLNHYTLNPCLCVFYLSQSEEFPLLHSPATVMFCYLTAI